MTRYLYIFEDGTVALGTLPPTPADLIMVDDGILQVVEITSDSPITVTEIGPTPEDCGPLSEAVRETFDGQESTAWAL